jgi:predicted dehydrogenase
MNRLRLYKTDDPASQCGFREILVTEKPHPYIEPWWPPGHLLGYEHSFVHTIADFVRAMIFRRSVAPSFADGLATQRVLAAIEESARAKRWTKL